MVSYEDIVDARKVISPHIIRTPLIYSPTFSNMTGARIYLKLETLQKAGSFKVRGASYRILKHRDEISEKGVIAASAGNHAQGVAVAASIADVPATIVMPVHASLTKQVAARGYGAEVILSGTNLQESIDHARKVAGEEGLTFIHPYNDPDIIAGQGTIALEIYDDLPSVDTIVVPVGGGGLISGIATAAAAQKKKAEIIGVQADACPAVFDSFREGKISSVNPGSSVADGILVPRPGDLTLPVIRSLVSDIVLVRENDIIDAMLLLLERKKIIAEGAGATPLAAVLNGNLPIRSDSAVVLVISGGNIDVPLFTRVIEQALIRQGRLMYTSVILIDVPGSLAALLRIIADDEGNIISIGQRRSVPDHGFFTVIVEIGIETRGSEHAAKIRGDIQASGYAIL
jgi:threonine dehydratase